jgi:hypothetical protein
MRYFGGLEMEEIDLLGISTRQVERERRAAVRRSLLVSCGVLPRHVNVRRSVPRDAEERHAAARPRRLSVTIAHASFTFELDEHQKIVAIEPRVDRAARAHSEFW